MARQTWRAGESLNSGGINIEINPPGGDGDGTAVTANPPGTDGEDLTRVAIAGDNYNLVGMGGGGGDTITINFARKGLIRSTGVGGRTYVTIIEPVGAGTTNDMANWNVRQAYRLGNDVFSRTYMFTDLTDDAAYIQRDLIVTNRAVDTYNEQTYTER